MLEKVKNCIFTNNLLCENETVIVGFSGGADSVCLLHVLKTLGYNVKALHVEHGIRGEESLQDALFAKNFCKINNVEFFINQDRIEKSKLPDTTRNLRDLILAVNFRIIHVRYQLIQGNFLHFSNFSHLLLPSFGYLFQKHAHILLLWFL